MDVKSSRQSGEICPRPPKLPQAWCLPLAWTTKGRRRQWSQANRRFGIVSVHPIAVVDAAPVYSRIILYEVNSLYSVTLYCCDSSLCCTCIERTAYRGDISESDKADRCKKTQVHWMQPVLHIYIYIYIYIYRLVAWFILYGQFGWDITVCDYAFVQFLHFKANVLFTMLASCMH